MFYDDDDVARPPTRSGNGEREGEYNNAGSASPRPGTASRDARLNRANQLQAKRKERSSIGMVMSSEAMPRPSTAVGSRPSTPSTDARTASTTSLPILADAAPNPTSSPHLSHPSHPSHPSPAPASSPLASNQTPPPRTPSTTNITRGTSQYGEYPRPPTGMPPASSEYELHPGRTLTESERELLKRGISPTFDPNFEKPQKPVLDLTDIKTFVMRPPPKGGMVQCRIVREKGGLLYPQYYLFLEENNSFLLAARKRKKSKSANYLISLDKSDMARDGPCYMGKLRSNFVGTEFTIYDRGVSHKERAPASNDSSQLRQELGAICYGSNVLGFKGPRKMTVIIPALKDNTSRLTWRPTNSDESIIEHFKGNNYANMVILQNKTPVWNEETGSYVLNFHNRVKQASVKNFQLVHPDDPEYIIMQFGRVSDDTFTMDFQYPMCMMQAFAIALSSFDNKLACE